MCCSLYVSIVTFCIKRISDQNGFPLPEHYLGQYQPNQDEVDIVNLAQTNVVLSLPGTGDGVQAVKAGLLEIADIFVVNKADRPGALQAVRQLQMLLDIEGPSRHGWAVPVLQTNAVEGAGLTELATCIDEHYGHLRDSDEGLRRQNGFRETALREALRAEISDGIKLILETPDGQAALEGLKERTVPARDVARGLLSAYLPRGLD